MPGRPLDALQIVVHPIGSPTVILVMPDRPLDALQIVVDSIGSPTVTLVMHDRPIDTVQIAVDPIGSPTVTLVMPDRPIDSIVVDPIRASTVISVMPDRPLDATKIIADPLRGLNQRSNLHQTQFMIVLFVKQNTPMTKKTGTLLMLTSDANLTVVVMKPIGIKTPHLELRNYTAAAFVMPSRQPKTTNIF